MPEPNPQDASEPAAAKSPLSVERLRQAFSQMLGKRPAVRPTADADQPSADEPTAAARTQLADDQLANDDGCPIIPQSIVEAMLFVGRPDARPLSSREMAAAMRGVSPREVEAAIQSLNELYQRDAAPYEIAHQAGGFRLVLREEFARVRDKFYGRVREARLSPAVIEVLSLVAYHQPITVARIDQFRGSPSGGLLRSLVRRELVRVERPPDRPRQPDYYTTARFLRLFGLTSLDELPRPTELTAA
jgi:segregation and condensation protein B